MGKLGGFLQIERHGVPQRDPPSARTTTASSCCTRPVAELREQGARCMDCGVPFCHNGCPLGNLIPDWNDLVYRDRFEDAIAQLHATNNFPEFTGPAVPGAVRGGVRARDPRGRRGHDQTDRERDHRPRLGGGLGHAAAAAPRRETGQAVAVVGLRARRAWPPRSSCAAPGTA